MEALDAFVHIAVAAIGAAGGAYGAIAAAKIQAQREKDRKPRKGRSHAVQEDAKDKGDNKMMTSKQSRKRPFWTSPPFTFLIAPAGGALIALGLLHGGRAVAQAAGRPVPIQAPTLIEGYFYPSGWMGDGEKGARLVQLNDQWKENPHSAPTCVRISYQPSAKGWAGVYWQYPDSNWGDKPGRKIEGATKLSFWARGEKGGELVEFKAGGIDTEGKKYHDSFVRTLGVVKLTPEWRRFEIPLTGADTSSVLGAFAWVANRNGNPDGLVFFVDDIRYE